MFEIVVYLVAVSLYGTFEAEQLRPGDFSSARTFVIIEEKAVRIRTGVTELPGVAVTASVLAVCDFPGDLVYLKIVAAPDILAEALVEGIEPGGCGRAPIR